MNKQVLVFCHGFGFNHEFWQNIKEYFSSYHCIYINLGYFENALEDGISIDINTAVQKLSAMEDAEIIGIGHSFGLLKLMQSGINFSKLVGLNAFINFIGSSAELRKRRIVEYDFCREVILQSPQIGLAQFYERSLIFGFMAKGLPTLNYNRIREDLVVIYEENGIETKVPTLILGTECDVVVPPEIIEDNFKGIPNVEIEILQKGGHGLGYNEASVVASKIHNFI